MKLVLCVVPIALLAGCGPASSYVRRSQATPIKQMAIGQVRTLLRDDQCVYYKDYDTKDFYRVSLDGKVRERALRGGKSKMVQLVPTRPSAKAQGRIHVASVPGGSGYTVLDVVAARPTLPNFDERSSAGVAHIANSDKRTAWTIGFVVKGGAIEPGHTHDYWDKVVFTKGATKSVYDFERSDQMNIGVWLLDESHALLFDQPNVIVWNLSTDKRTCIARAERIVLWPRDLHKKERFAPIAKWGDKTADYEWKLSSPDDVVPKPEYIKRKRGS